MNATEIAIQLLMMEQQINEFTDASERAGIEFSRPIFGNFVALNLALDVMGIPKDETLNEDNSFNPDPEAFCRDWLTDQWHDMKPNGKVGIRRFMEWVHYEMERINART